MPSGTLQHEMVADDDMVGVAALADRPVVIVLAVVGLDAALAAEDFPAFQALVALHAAVDHAADRDRIANAVAGDFIADRRDGADDLVARDDRVARAAPVVAAGVQVAVADAGVGDLDGDIVGPERAAFEFHRPQRLVGRVRAPALGDGRSVCLACPVRFCRRRHDQPPILICSKMRLRLHEVRAIDHFAADGQHARVGLCLERGDNRLRMGDVVGRRREGGIDHRHLGRMDGQLAGEAFAACGLGFGAQALLVAEIGEDAVDRLDAGGDRPGKAERARQLVGEAQARRSSSYLDEAPSAADKSSAPQLIAASGELGSR